MLTGTLSSLSSFNLEPKTEWKKKNPWKLMCCCQAQPEFPWAVVSFLRVEGVLLDTCQDTGTSHLPVVKRLTAFAGQVWEQ